ncbi:MAG TPA: lipid-A-disaccharide synthase-related protein [Trueperaceae bacterium]|nr:lipid-A-disaccharide synthase-related protein [Trueperaceae bacterium]
MPGAGMPGAAPIATSGPFPGRRPASVVIVSNGHGEDVIGAALAQALLAHAPELNVRAFPLVDDGAAYRALGLELLGPCKVMPSGGAMMHSLSLLRADLRAGFVGMSLWQAAALAGLRCDLLLVVGDVYGQALSALARGRRRAVLQPLVSARHMAGARAPRPNRYFMERIGYLERALMRHLAAVVYARDEATASWLRARGVTQAEALGNPMVDRAVGEPLAGLPAGPVLALLPGTRAYAPLALRRMAAVLERLPGVTGLVAWAGGPVPPLPDWVAGGPARRPSGVSRVFERESARLWLVEGRFGDVLASAQVALGTAGTAHEQAAAMGVPVVSFPLAPHYTAAFLANQQRLLGAALTVTDGGVSTAVAAVRRLLDDAALRARCGREGASRMGPPGGSERIARDLLRRLEALPGGSGAPAGHGGS